MIAKLNVRDLFFCDLITTHLDGLARVSAENIRGWSDYATVDRNAMLPLVMAGILFDM